MPALSSELLVYAAIVAAFLIFNYAMQRLTRKAREAREAGVQRAPEPPEVPAEAAAEPLDDYSWGRASAAPEEVVRAQAMHAVQPVAVPIVGPSYALDAGRLKRRLRGQEDLREAVALMTILGPCRALEPYDRSASNHP